MPIQAHPGHRGLEVPGCSQAICAWVQGEQKYRAISRKVAVGLPGLDYERDELTDATRL